MFARGRDTGLPVLAATTSAQIAPELADLVNVVVALPAQDTALRAGEFLLTVKDPPRLVSRGCLVRARVPSARAARATAPRRVWEGT
jgi:hypothetical protein